MSYVLSKILAGEKAPSRCVAHSQGDRDCLFLHEFATRCHWASASMASEIRGK
jgi:hypothetical protein